MIYNNNYTIYGILVNNIKVIHKMLNKWCNNYKKILENLKIS